MSQEWLVIVTAVLTVILSGILQYLFLFNRRKNSLEALLAEISANREIMFHNRNRCQQMRHEISQHRCETDTVAPTQPPTQIFYMLDKLLNVMHDPEMTANEKMRKQYKQLMVQLKHQNSMIEEMKFLYRSGNVSSESKKSLEILLNEQLVFIANDRIDSLPRIFERTLNEMIKNYAPLLDDPVWSTHESDA
jgi:hypothetical protein